MFARKVVDIGLKEKKNVSILESGIAKR